MLRSSSTRRGATRLFSSPELHGNIARPARPSLRITRDVGRAGQDRFTVEIWSPFTACYQPVDSIEGGLQRIEELARLIGQMWLQRHPKRVVLVDPPDVNEVDGAQWAELRRTATESGHYDTRCFHRMNWAPAAGPAEAVETMCNEVGYVRLNSVPR